MSSGVSNLAYPQIGLACSSTEHIVGITSKSDSVGVARPTSNIVHQMGITDIKSDRSDVVDDGKFLVCWSLLIASAPKTLSAGLYLFDFVTNILVLKEYWLFYKRRYFSFNYNALGGHDNLVPFAACLAFMVAQHILNGVAFKVKLPPEEHPFRSAFFLPIVQFRRFVGSFYKTGSFAYSSSARSESFETEALYAVMSAVEAGPQLVIQFTVSFALGGSQVSRNTSSAYNHQKEWHLKKLLVVSIVACLLSASYNTGRAVMYKMCKRWTFTLNVAGITGGMYTCSVLLLRCTTVASIVFQIDEKGYDHSVLVRLLLAFYYCVGVLPLSYMNGLLAVSLKRENVLRSRASQLEVIVAAYISTVIGPLYSIVEGYGSIPRDKEHKPKRTLGSYLRVATCVNFLSDGFFLTLLTLNKSTTCKFETQNTFESFPSKDLSITFTCLQFGIYIGIGIAFSILACIILPCFSSISLVKEVTRVETTIVIRHAESTSSKETAMISSKGEIQLSEVIHIESSSGGQYQVTFVGSGTTEVTTDGSWSKPEEPVICDHVELDVGTRCVKELSGSSQGKTLELSSPHDI